MSGTSTGPRSSRERANAPDMVFAAVVSRLPAQLREAMEESQLIDPGLLRHYPRTCWRLLGLGASPVQRTTMVLGISSASQARSEAVRLVGTGCGKRSGERLARGTSRSREAQCELEE